MYTVCNVQCGERTVGKMEMLNMEYGRTRCKTAGKNQRGLEPKRVSKPRCLLSDKCVNKNLKQNQCNVYERNGQLVFTRNSEIVLPKDAPVRLLSAQLEELDYEKLYRAYSPKGRKSAADPRVLFKVLVHGYLCGI